MAPTKRATPAQSNPFSLSRFRTALLLIVLLGGASYSNTLHGPFLFDDSQNIVTLEGIHLQSFSADQLAGLWRTAWAKGRPTAMISFALNYYFGGLDTFGYHLLNLIIHLSSALAAYLLVKTTLSLPALQERYGKVAGESALLSALLFVAHPVQTQAVSYIVQRMASLVALFFILSLYLYAKARIKHNKTLFGGAFFCALLALGSKQNAITLPFFICLYEYYFFQRLKLPAAGKKRLYWLFALLGVSLLAGLVYSDFNPGQLLAGYRHRDFTLGQRLLTQPRVIVFYLSLLLAPLPSRLNLDHHFPISYSLINPASTLPCLLFVLGLAAISIRLARKRPLFSFCLIWFWGNLLLESSFLPLELVFEHRLYLPSLGLFLLFSLGLARASQHLSPRLQVPVKAGVMLALILPLSIMTYQRNEVWQDEVRLWEDACRKSPQKARTNYNLAHVYADRGRLPEAIHYYKRTLAIDPAYEDVHNNLANIYIRQGKPGQAVKEHLAEIKHNPDNAKAYNNLGNTYLDQGLPEQARRAYQKAIRLAPDFAAAYYGLANYHAQMGAYSQAIENYRKAIRLRADFAEAWCALATIHEKQQDYRKAVQAYRRAISLKPQLFQAHLGLGTLYTKLKDFGRARRLLRRALQLQPQSADAHYNLGISYLLSGNRRRAEQEYLATVKLAPKHYLAHKELGIIYLNAGQAAKALFHFQKSLSLAPDQPQAQLIKDTIARLKSGG